MVFFCISCSHKDKLKNVEVNPEIFGQWKSDGSCQLLLEKSGDRVKLVRFDSDDQHLQNVNLIAYKESIMTKFKSESNDIFRASFLEGVIMVDKFCKQPLHKVDNY